MIFSCIVTALAIEPEEGDPAPAAETSGDALTALFGALSMDRLTELTAQLNKDLAQAVRQSRNEKMAAAAARSVLLNTYGGAMVVNGGAALYAEADEESDVVRTVASGKVARLTESADGWYEVSFDTCSGYMKAEDCLVVRYSDYLNSSASSLLIDDVIAYAFTYLGTPYVYGGASYRGTDCSGFTMQVFNHFGYNLPRTVSAQYAVCRRVSDSERRPGDLLFFNTYGGLSHVGIYLGNGQFIHAGSYSGVAVRSLSESYFANTYLFAGRIIGK